jgi:hypothetical protein
MKKFKRWLFLNVFNMVEVRLHTMKGYVIVYAFEDEID